MSSVTFSASVGGNGSTVTDDSNASTGLANGGHITRFVPALAQVVAVAGVTVAAAATASATANATAWISGTTYALYTAVISPANQQTYRRLVAGGGTTDPATDTANWASISSARVDILTHAAASKTTPADTDELPIIDSAAAYFLKKLTWANLKAALWSSPAFTGSATFNGAGNMPGYKNMIVNGGFNVWQRGTTIANPGGVSADCWRGAGAIGETVSRIADHPSGGGYCAEFTHTSGSEWFMNRIEAINCKKLVGKTVTASFWAKCISGSTSQVVGLDYPINSADDNYTSSTAQIGSFLFATTSTWTKFIFSWVIPTGATKGLQFRIITGASSAAVIRVADVQLEEGSTASAFEMPPYSLELAQCQRYYRRINDPTSAYGSIALGINSSATIGQFIITGLGMRPGSATATISGLQTLVGGAVTTITTALITANGDAQVTITTGTNAVNAVNLLLQANNTAGYLDLSREL